MSQLNILYPLKGSSVAWNLELKRCSRDSCHWLCHRTWSLWVTNLWLGPSTCLPVVLPTLDEGWHQGSLDMRGWYHLEIHSRPCMPWTRRRSHWPFNQTKWIEIAKIRKWNTPKSHGMFYHFPICSLLIIPIWCTPDNCYFLGDQNNSKLPPPLANTCIIS